MKQISFHGKQENKDAVLAEIAIHEKADMYFKGEYWDEEEQKGCAIGCLLKSGNHVEYEQRFGVPEWLAYLEDIIFEGLLIEESKKWPRRFMETMPVGEDEKYFNAVFHFISVKRIDRLPLMVNQDVNNAISTIRKLHVSNEKNSLVWSTAWSAAWSAAESAAESAAWSAAWSAARSEAESVAWSAAWSAWSSWSAAESARPAWSAAESAWSAAESAACAAESNVLIEALNMSYDELTTVFIEE